MPERNKIKKEVGSPNSSPCHVSAAMQPKKATRVEGASRQCMWPRHRLQETDMGSSGNRSQDIKFNMSNKKHRVRPCMAPPTPTLQWPAKKPAKGGELVGKPHFTVWPQSKRGHPPLDHRNGLKTSFWNTKILTKKSTTQTQKNKPTPPNAGKEHN